ncbi:MAG: ORF6N domain-containing protein, partial [Casimicrobiaceae bacterium]
MRPLKPTVSPDAAASVAQRIAIIRGQRVMLDADLAALYEVETRALIQAVKRNKARFPDDFMFRLDADEAAQLRSHSVMSNAPGRGGRRH